MSNQRKQLTVVFCLAQLAVSSTLSPTAVADTPGSQWVVRGNVPVSQWTTVGPGDMDTDSVMVSMIQYLLRAHGCHVIVDGEFGTTTQRQIRIFQRQQGLRVIGIVTGRTWSRLILPIHRGSQGDAVRAAQASLQQMGDEGLPIDGKFGARTERAVRALQKEDGLRVDGMVGPVTWLHLTDPVPD